MKSQKTIVVLVLGVGFLLLSRPALAAFFDRDKLAHALAIRFNLNEGEVTKFLADFQYDPDLSATPTATPTLIPTPTPAATPTPVPTVLVATKVAQPSIVKEGITYKYDSYTDKYYQAKRIVSIQRQNNLDFIEERLDNEVKGGRMTRELESRILEKLVEMMEKAPSSEEFAGMSFVAQNSAISRFKKEMDGWMKGQGMTLVELREMMGKGNKFLMGIYLE